MSYLSLVHVIGSLYLLMYRYYVSLYYNSNLVILVVNNIDYYLSLLSLLHL
jgi:hypothetical protein